MKKSFYRFGQGHKSASVGLCTILLLLSFQTFAQNQNRQNDAARSVNALLNFATRLDREDRNYLLDREKFTLPDRATPLAHAVLSAIAQTAGSPDTLNRGQRAQAIHEAMSEVIKPSEIAATVFAQEREFFKENERAKKITKEMAKAIEEKLSNHNDFKLASIEEKIDSKDREREQKFERFGNQEEKDRSDLVSKIANFNDGKESKSKELERLAFNKTDNGRSGSGDKGGNGGGGVGKKDDTPAVVKAADGGAGADNAQAGSNNGNGSSDDNDKDKDKGKK